WTHHPRDPMEMRGGTTFHFVGGTPAEILELARDAAGGLDVRIGGGPTTVNEFLRADLVDYLHIVVVPIVLGRGVPLWNGLGGFPRGRGPARGQSSMCQCLSEGEDSPAFAPDRDFPR